MATWTQGWNFAAAMKHWANNGLRKATEAQYEQRRAICDACPSGLLTASGQCGDGVTGGCGCFVALKAAIIEKPGQSDCPNSHWPQINAGLDAMQAPPPRLPRPEKVVSHYKPGKPIAEEARRIVFRINKGLGDAMGFRTVLMHLQKHRPNWTVDVNCHHFHDSIYRGLCRNLIRDVPVRGAEYDTIHTARFMRPKRCLSGCPSNTTQAFLKDVCRVQPDLSMCGYGRLEPSQEEREAARAVVAPLGNKVILWHSRGRSFRNAKNPHAHEWRPFLERAEQLGYAVLSLDFDRNCEFKLPRVDHATTGFDTSSQHGTILAALIAQVSLFVGVDSGPLHVAGACDTPSIGVWLRHHPVHSYNLAANVLHLVPRDHEKNLPTVDRIHGVRVFHEHYRHAVYADLPSALVQHLEAHDAATTTL